MGIILSFLICGLLSCGVSDTENEKTYQEVYYNDIFRASRNNEFSAKEIFEKKSVKFMAKIYSISSNGNSFTVADGKITCTINEDLKSKLLTLNNGDYILLCGELTKVGAYSMNITVEKIEIPVFLDYNNAMFGMSYQEIRDIERNEETAVSNGTLYFSGSGYDDEYGLSPVTIMYNFSSNGVRKITVSYNDVDEITYMELVNKFKNLCNIDGTNADDAQKDLKRTVFKTSTAYITIGYFTDSNSISLIFMDPTEYIFDE